MLRCIQGVFGYQKSRTFTIDDISRTNKTIHIRDSKSRFDRYTLLADRTLEILTEYWFKCGRPTGILFQSSWTGDYLVRDSVNQFFRESAKRAAIQKMVDSRIYGYTCCECIDEYYDAVTGWFKRAYNWDVKKEDVLFYNGTNDAVEVALRAFAGEGVGVIITKPLYGPLVAGIKNAGCEVVTTKFEIQDGKYRFDFNDLEEKAKDPNNKVFLLCNPHNPTGRVFDEQELKTIADICRRHDVVIVCDEVHADIVRENVKFQPIAKVAGGQGIVTATAISKSFNCAGLLMTNMIIQDEALRKEYAAKAGMKMTSSFGVAAVIAAYTKCDDWLREVNLYLDKNIEWALNFLKEKMPKVKVIPPEGTYMLWMNFEDYGITPAEIRRRIYYDANVILEEGASFDDENGAYYERICLSTRFDIVKQAFEDIE